MGSRTLQLINLIHPWASHMGGFAVAAFQEEPGNSPVQEPMKPGGAAQADWQVYHDIETPSEYCGNPNRRNS